MYDVGFKDGSVDTTHAWLLPSYNALTHPLPQIC